MRKLKRELGFLLAYPAQIGLGAFLCAVGGVVLWVSGGSGWYYLKAGQLPSLTAVFLLWTLLYALYGCLLAVILLTGKSILNPKAALVGAAATAASYLLSLGWYAVFFCTRLQVFAAILLILAAAGLIAAAISMRRTLILTFLAFLVLIGSEFYFICLTFSAIL